MGSERVLCAVGGCIALHWDTHTRGETQDYSANYNTHYLNMSWQVTAAELKVILDRYTNTDLMAMNGLMVGGTKYMFLSANDRVIRGKKGTAGVHCIKIVQALIVCVYEEPVVPEQAATVTE